MTSLCITWHDTTQAITSHQMTWPSHDLTPQQTSRHQNTSLQSTKHHHHGTAEGSFTAKKWFGHRAGRSPCAHSIGKFFLCYILLFPFGNFRPRLVRALLVYIYIYYVPTKTPWNDMGNLSSPSIKWSCLRMRFSYAGLAAIGAKMRSGAFRQRTKRWEQILKIWGFPKMVVPNNHGFSY